MRAILSNPSAAADAQPASQRMPIVTQFLIVGTYRTGSSAVVRSLQLHPKIACGLEWTQQMLPWRTLKSADRILSGDSTVLLPKHHGQMEAMVGPSTVALGFKRLFRASDKWLLTPALGPLLVDRLEAHIRWVQARPHIRIIHIVRENDLAWLKSKALADATGKYAGTAYPENLKVYVPPREAVRRVRAKRYLDARLETLSASNPYLKIVYEAFAADNHGKTSEMVEFLGCDPRELKQVDLRARIQSRAGNQIENLAQVRAALDAAMHGGAVASSAPRA
jgi:LPS sulfotransferase NodH